MSGWVKLYRQLLNWEWYTDSNMVHLFIHLVLSANHKDGEWKGQKIHRGQLVTGRKQLEKQTGISQQTIRTCLVRLQRTNEICQKSTNKYSIITICNYDNYQPTEIEANQQLTSNQPATNHKQEVKNKKNTTLLNGEHKTIINFLNEKTGKNFKPTTKKTQGLIKARLLEDFTVEDFKKVISVKASKWKGTEYEKFLRPETLFGNKFEGYLQEDGGSNSEWI